MREQKTQFEYCEEEYQIVRLTALVALFNKVIDTPKMRVFNWIIENLNANNFMKRQGYCFMVNPAIIAVKGDNRKNLVGIKGKINAKKEM